MGRKQPGTKICSRCETPRSYDFFQRRPNGKVYSWCKDCHAEHQKIAREPKKKESNKRIQELRAIRREVLRKIVVDYLKHNPCIKCNETDIVVLEFDHRDSATKEFCISDALRDVPSVERLSIEIAKCDILCANCHRRKTALSNKNFKVGA
jgi:hypothetical protein